MPAQALYLKWRPRTFGDVIGQEHITRSLRNAIIQNRVRHAYLFNGPRGTGKTTMARLLAKAVNCQHPDPAQRPCDTCRFCEAINEGRFLDLIEIDAASHNGVDDVRDLRDKIAFAPSEGRFKVYIVDEVHRFSGAAFDALLKTLEEPPEHAIFVLATTDLDKVPPTIRSRSLIFEFRRVSVREIADRLDLIASSEGVAIDRSVLELVAQQGTGSVRDSISLLDQLIADPDEPIGLDYAERVLGTAASRVVGRLAQAIIENDAAFGLDLINQAIDDGADPGQLGRQIVEYLRNLLLVQTGGLSLVDASDDLRERLAAQAAQVSRTALVRAVRAFNAALSEVRSGWQPQLPLELALIESTRLVQETVEAPGLQHSPDAVPTIRPSAPPREHSAPAEAAGGESLGEISLGDLRQVWPEIIRRLKDTRNYISLAATLEHAIVQAVDGNVVVLAVDQPVFKSKLEERRETLTEIVGKLFQVPVHFRVVVADAEAQAQVDDTIMNDPLIAEQLKSGGRISLIEDTQGGID